MDRIFVEPPSASPPVDANSVVTLQSIADLLSLNRATVSRALSGAPGIADATRQRILDAAKRLDYRPDPIAKALAGKSTGMIGILWSSGPADVRERIRIALSLRSQDRGFTPILMDTSSEPHMFCKTVDHLRRFRVDGLIASSSTPEIELSAFAATGQKLPSNTILSIPNGYAISDPWTDADILVRDYEAAVRVIARHFVALGRRRPLVYMGHHPFKVPPFFDECRRLGLALSTEQNQFAPEARWSWKGAEWQNALDRKFGGLPFPYDAVFASNDAVAVALLDWLRKRGLRTPEDVAVVGFDDFEAAPFTHPPLASVSHEGDAITEWLFDRLFSRLEGDRSPLRRDRISLRPVWRESAGGAGGWLTPA